jgi:hypothetical protein
MVHATQRRRRSVSHARRAAVAVAATLGTGMAAADAAESLNDYAWKDRILIVFSASGQSNDLAEQRRIIQDASAAFDDRSLRVVEVVGDRVSGASDSADALRKRYGIDVNAFKVLLIGKDSGVKIASSTPLNAQDLNRTIDAMPMRRSEVQSR